MLCCTVHYKIEPSEITDSEGQFSAMLLKCRCCNNSVSHVGPMHTIGCFGNGQTYEETVCE